MRLRNVVAGVVAGSMVVCGAAVAPAGPPERPWPPEYKLRPGETDRLTPADVPGPDGIVYPNWTRVGVPGGIPAVPVAAKLTDHGGRADDGKDDAAALNAACRAVGSAGGGAVLLGEGTYHLDRPVTVRHDGVVIRGAGREKTRLVFRYAVGKGGASFYWPAADGRVGPETLVQLHCRPAGLMAMSISAGGKLVREWKRSRHSGNTFALTCRGREVLAKVGPGKATLVGTGRYRDGKTVRCEIPVVADPKHRDDPPPASTIAAVTFEGRPDPGKRIKLASDGRRGATKLTLEHATGLSAGDRIRIDGPATKRWKALTRNKCPWGLYRRYEVLIRAVDGRTVELDQPLRITFPVIDGSWVQEIAPIRRCGLEGVTIEQTENLWITAAMFHRAWECWARDVKVIRCGRQPVYARHAKWCEIRDCVFDDAWFKGGGGTAYVGWERACDCLMENVETYKFRHGPLFQWAASGCVIRESTFHDSDAQWHSGWTNENLIERCTVISRRGHGSYGYGAWASPPEDTAHGPNGPRNVVYHCDIRSQRAGLWMGGMNENWLILHNRFVVGKGHGVFAKTASFDHILAGNTFVLRDGRSAMVHLATADCVGVEIVDNKLYGGSGKVLTGPAKPERMEGNRALPAAKGDLPPRPAPAVESIYEWQRRNAGSGR